jgi:CheY-like chemotaxis protein
MNLVGNANKFTTNGDVVITVRQRVAGLAGFVIETSVADTGTGIAPDNHERLFQPFVQESAAVSGKFGGTGLGLAICKRLVELMGGEITLESTPGVGSTFTFTVILNEGVVDMTEARADAARCGSSGAYVLPVAKRALHVLAAEDNDTNRMLLTTLLARMGHTIDAVEDGAQAVAALDRKSYDIILMDMQMPVMDGVAATQAIRAAGNRIPIIALTADGLPENHRRYLDSGIDGIMTKPIDWTVLAEEMDKLTSTNRRVRDAAEVLQSAAHPSSTDVLVEPALLSVLVETVGRDLVVSLMNSLRSTVGLHMEEMARAVEAGDGNTAARAAHGVKGVVSQFGAVRLTNAARRAEVDARAGSLSRAHLIEMQRLVDATLAALADALAIQPVR